MEAKVDYQVAAPVELRTPNLHRANNRSQKSADGRMATAAARLKRQNILIRKRKKKTDLTLTGLLMEGLGLRGYRGALRLCYLLRQDFRLYTILDGLASARS